MGGRHKILVVDDDENLLTNLRVLLTDVGLDVVCVSRPAAALAEVVLGDVDSILVDYRLGTQSGLELIDCARELAPGVPVVLMSADLDGWARAFARDRVAVRCIEKPFRADELLALITETRAPAESSEEHAPNTAPVAP